MPCISISPVVCAASFPCRSRILKNRITVHFSRQKNARTGDYLIFWNNRPFDCFVTVKELLFSRRTVEEHFLLIVSLDSKLPASIRIHVKLEAIV